MAQLGRRLLASFAASYNFFFFFYSFQNISSLSLILGCCFMRWFTATSNPIMSPFLFNVGKSLRHKMFHMNSSLHEPLCYESLTLFCSNFFNAIPSFPSVYLFSVSMKSISHYLICFRLILFETVFVWNWQSILEITKWEETLDSLTI